MKQSYDIENSPRVGDDEVAHLLESVTFEMLLFLYPLLVEQARFVHPARVPAMSSSGVRGYTDEPFVVLLPSPDHGDGGPFEVVVFPRSRQWRDLSGRLPADVPRDFVGLVMVQSKCSSTEAIAILSDCVAEALAAGAEHDRAVQEVRTLMKEHAEIEFLGASIRESLLSRLN